VLGIRPESFEDATFADPSLPQLDVEVAVLEELGSDAHVLFQVDATPVHTEEQRQDRDAETLIAGDGAVFTARVDPATEARPGEPLRLAVDPAGFHYFDLETGENRRRGAAPEQAAQALQTT
jgi:multiple sugar transport system ATP-binding protein